MVISPSSKLIGQDIDSQFENFDTGRFWVYEIPALAIDRIWFDPLENNCIQDSMNELVSAHKIANRIVGTDCKTLTLLIVVNGRSSPVHLFELQEEVTLAPLLWPEL